MPAPQITAVVNFPQLGQSQQVFNTNANAFVTQIAAFQSEANILAEFVDLKASEAATSATNAANSATAAATSETNAATSETNADQRATDAETAAQKSEEVGKRALGPFAADPTLDNEGNPLVAGAMYYNTTTNHLMTYNGSAWVAGVMDANGALAAASNLADLTNKTAARGNLGLGRASQAQAEAGTSNSVSMTPLRTKQAINALLPEVIDEQVFNSSGTWTKPAGVKLVYVEMVGGGESGAGRGSTGNHLSNGGGGGAYVSGWFLADNLPNTVSVGVGAGGGKPTNAPSNPGGNSTFGTFLTAPGGGQAGPGVSGDGVAGLSGVQTAGPNSGAAGLSSPGGNSTRGGAGGGTGHSSNHTAGGVSVNGGDGGDAVIKGPGQGNATGQDGQAPGGGGGGAHSIDGNGTGGKGGKGRVRILAFK